MPNITITMAKKQLPKGIIRSNPVVKVPVCGNDAATIKAQPLRANNFKALFQLPKMPAWLKIGLVYEKTAQAVKITGLNIWPQGGLCYRQ